MDNTVNCAGICTFKLLTTLVARKLVQVLPHPHVLWMNFVELCIL